jgi:hypothetical protein
MDTKKLIIAGIIRYYSNLFREDQEVFLPHLMELIELVRAIENKDNDKENKN